MQFYLWKTFQAQHDDSITLNQIYDKANFINNMQQRTNHWHAYQRLGLLFKTWIKVPL